MNKTISITAYQRPKNLSDLLKGLSSNDLSNWKIFISLEPSKRTKECIDIIEYYLTNKQYSISVNPKVYGVRKNTFSVIEKAFESGSSLNVYLEEDLIVSPDILRLADWYHHHCPDDVVCLNFLSRITGSKACFSDLNYEADLLKTRSFNSLGIAFTRQQWINHLRDRWIKPPQHLLAPNGYKADGWDYAVQNLFLENPDLFVLQPLLARANHAAHEGTYCNSEYQNQAFSHIVLNQKSYNQYRITNLSDLASSARAYFLLAEEMLTSLNTLKSKEQEKERILGQNPLENLLERIKFKINESKFSAENQAMILKLKKKSLYKLLHRLLKHQK